jgi:hypothetical protein
VLGIAVVMLAWHNIWMSAHGRQLASDAKAMGGAVSSGTKAMSALAIVIGLAVLREGAETVLFLSGIALSGESSPASMAIGGIAGSQPARRSASSSSRDSFASRSSGSSPPRPSSCCCSRPAWRRRPRAS